MEAKAGYSWRSPSQASPPLAKLCQWRRRPAIPGEALAKASPPLAKLLPVSWPSLAVGCLHWLNVRQWRRALATQGEGPATCSLPPSLASPSLAKSSQ
ncbi:hypothetical protein R1flu_027178 [Riccia fluitans]|uniref:Uncharacterized protein n=1 Tax=Riccia fluitans TaxID=41844 RepID=A0ABD1XIK3_9MARC